jgi:hypothetical protein
MSPNKNENIFKNFTKLNLLLSGNNFNLGIKIYVLYMTDEFNSLIKNYNKYVLKKYNKNVYEHFYEGIIEEKLLFFTTKYFIRSINIFIKLFDKIFKKKIPLQSKNNDYYKAYVYVNGHYKNNFFLNILSKKYIIKYLNSLCKILIFDYLNKSLKNVKNVKNLSSKQNNSILGYKASIMNYCPYYSDEYYKSKIISKNTHYVINYFVVKYRHIFENKTPIFEKK